MIKRPFLTALMLAPFLATSASCSSETFGESSGPTGSASDAAEVSPQSPPSGPMRKIGPFMAEQLHSFNEPWAAAFEPGSGRLLITEQGGDMYLFDPKTGLARPVADTPKVDFGGQGGMGDIAFAPDYQTSKTIYLTWVEAGEDNTRGAVLGKARFDCDSDPTCSIRDLNIIWRQTPKTTGRGHYSHRISFSPDGQHIFLASGDRQKMAPAQDTSNNLGTIVRLNLDGSAAAGNPLADKGTPANQIWSWGHRNILGMAFAPDGRLWEVEHGPRGGDELNLVQKGKNYGWPIVSDGVHYDGKPIPDNDTRPDLASPALGWTPVIAPGDMIFVKGGKFPQWSGDLLITGLRTKSLIHVRLSGDNAKEVGRYDFGQRLRAIDEAPDGTLYVLEDGEDANLLRLTPAG